MKKLYQIYITVLIAGILTSVTFAQTKIAQTGFGFLEVSSDARSSGMAEAVNSLSGYPGALSYNPASMAEMPTLLNATFSINQWIADINYMAASVIVSPFSGDYGVVGISIQSVDYGDVEGTINNPYDPSGYTETGMISPTAFSIGVGYAKMLNDNFGVGGQIRYSVQKLGDGYVPTETGAELKENKASALSYDFGTVFKTGLKSLAFGMSVRNFSKEIKFESEDFQLPLIFTLGISADLFDFFEVPGPEQSLLLSLDTTHPRSHAEQVKFGLEYKFMNMFALRGGYVSGNDENDVCFGVGVTQFGVELDYAYTPFGVFDNVQRFTARISL
ncbi:MAG: PorV/PorQ family protein [bacterium]